MRARRRASTLLLPLLFTILLSASLHTFGVLPTSSDSYISPGSTSSSPIPTTDTSWNPAVPCTATITTIEQILGTQYNTTTGGALYSGGGLKPGIPNKRALNPPCTYGSPANPTFVEIRNITVAGSTMILEECSTNYAPINGGGPFPNGENCNLSRNLFDPSGPRIPNVTCPRCMRGIFVEIDRNWNASGTAPPPIGVNGTKERIDVQGFLYWNPDEIDKAWHLYSGWELHPLTSWRRTGETNPDYYIANKRLLNLQSGYSGSTTVYLGSLLGFHGTITLTASASDPALSTTLDTTSVTLDPTGANSSTRVTLTISAPDTAPGAYLVTVTGTSGALIHKSLTTVVVVKPDFTIVASQDYFNMDPRTTANSTLTLTSTSGYTGNVSLVSSASKGGLTLTINPSTVALSPVQQANATLEISLAPTADPGIHSIYVTATDNTLSHSVVILVEVVLPPPTQGFDITASPGAVSIIEGQTGTAQLTVTPVNGFNENVTLTLSLSPETGLSCSLSSAESDPAISGTVTLSCTGTAGAYNVLVTGSSTSGFSRSDNIAFTVERMASLSAAPDSIIMDAGEEGSSIITAQDFQSSVSIEVSWTPTGGILCGLDTDTLTGQDDAAVLSCSGAAGTYLATVSGYNEVQTATVVINYTIEDFALTLAAADAKVNPGTVAQATVSLESLNGFNRTVTVEETVSPASGLNCILAQNSFDLNSTVSFSTSCTGSPGTYTVKITATSNTLSHVAELTVAVTDFLLFPAGQTLTLKPGQQGTVTVGALALHGFEGDIQLSMEFSAPGFKGTLTSYTLKVYGYGITTALLRVTANNTIQPGSYALTVNATSGPFSHNLTVTITVPPALIPPSGNSSRIGQGLLQLSIVVLALIATPIVAIAFGRRRSVPNNSTEPSQMETS